MVDKKEKSKKHIDSNYILLEITPEGNIINLNAPGRGTDITIKYYDDEK